MRLMTQAYRYPYGADKLFYYNSYSYTYYGSKEADLREGSRDQAARINSRKVAQPNSLNP